MKFIDSQGRNVVARGWEEGKTGNCLMGTEFQLGKMKNFWRWMVVMLAHKVNSLNRILQNGKKMVNFVLYILTSFLKAVK